MTNLYEFRDLSKQASASNLPSEALTFGGVNIDKELAGYRTLNVSGRENFTRTLNTASSTADGELFISSKLDTNEITIKYLLTADTVDDFNKLYTRLKLLLQGEEKTFSFSDESEFTRTGTVISLDNDNAGVIETTGTIKIKMLDPYRHGQTKTISGTSSIVFNDPQLMYTQNVDKITLVATADTQTLVVNINNSYKLTLINASITANSNIVIDIVNRNITMNGVSQLNKIDVLNTNMFEAKVTNGDMITCQQAKSLTATYRVKII